MKGTPLLRKMIGSIAAAVMLVSTPAAAQEPGEMEAFAVLAQAFQAEPLTAEQEARLPRAAAIIDKMIPPGSMQEVMGSLFGNVLDPMMSIATTPTDSDAAELLGLEAGDLALGEGHAAEIVAIVDPAHEERATRTAKAMPEAMKRMMAATEPTMRKALAEAYAIHFGERELTDIGAFFDTPSGIAYARKSMSMASDPRFIGSMMQSMPQMMAGVGEMEAILTAAVADLPPTKGYADLTAAERKRLAELTGLDEATLELAMDTTALEDEGSSEDE